MPETAIPDALTQDIQHVERAYRKKITVVTTRPRVTRAAYFAWGALVTCTILFFLATVGWYGVQGMFDDKTHIASILTNSQYTQDYARALAPQSLTQGSVQSVSSGSDGYVDVYVELTNPNTRHAAIFSYIFTYSDGETAVKTSFLNPKETAYIIAPRITQGRPQNLAFFLQDVTWEYLSPHRIANISEWHAEHDAFAVSDAFFASDITYADATVSRATFLVDNRTPYSYWEPVFVVRISRGTTLLGITEITAAQFIAGEQRAVETRWFGDLPQTASLSVTPRIPYFDEDAYMDPEASHTNDVRNRWTPGRR